MAGLFKIKDIEARKRTLLVNSESYRQTLRAELNNVRLAGRATIQQKLSFLRFFKPGLLGVIAPLISWFFMRKRQQHVIDRSLKGQLLGQLQPLWKGLLMRGITAGISRIFQKR